MSQYTVCDYKDICSGCQLWDTPFQQQGIRKIADLRAHLSKQDISFSGEIEFLSAGASQLRDRLDFTWQQGRLGLFKKDSRDIADLDICQQLSPELQAWLSDFRKFKWPTDKASIRLRVGPRGQRGAWLDLANIDIKNLLEQKDLLLSLQKEAFVEIGQRRKVPHWNGESFKLKDPEHHVWFQTWMKSEPIDLFCQVASFTQPSLKANKVIAEHINQWVKAESDARVIEFGSGIGNLTFPALGHASSLTACEIDSLALDGLKQSLTTIDPQIAQKVQIHRGDFQRKLSDDFSKYDLVLANPPRSGLQKFLNPLLSLSKSSRPVKFIYMSCFPESMAIDLRVLKECGYHIEELKIIDQFPQTHHYEVLAKLSL